MARSQASWHGAQPPGVARNCGTPRNFSWPRSLSLSHPLSPIVSASKAAAPRLKQSARGNGGGEWCMRPPGLRPVRGHGAELPGGVCGRPTVCVCCFVLLEPTWMLYRVPRVSPGVTAPMLRSPPSRATPGPPRPYRPLQSARYHYPGLTVCPRAGGEKWGRRKRHAAARGLARARRATPEIAALVFANRPKIPRRARPPAFARTRARCAPWCAQALGRGALTRQLLAAPGRQSAF